MSTIYTGNPANVTTPLTATVTGATNVAPIVITTVANHLYATNDLVTVSGVTGNTAANGAWTIIVLSPTTFSLTGTTGNGAYAGGGTCSDNSLTPQFTIPSDGDAFNVSSVNVAMQAIADRTQYLALRVVPLASLAALASILAPANGAGRHVVGQGLYTFQTSATAGLLPFRVAAADGTAGGWVVSSAYQTALTRFVTLNGNVRISASVGAIAPVLTVNALTNNMDFAYPTVAQAGLSDRGFFTNIVYSAGAGSYAWSMPLDQSLVDGSTLSSATLYFTPVGGHVAVPTIQPWIGIIRNVRAGYNPTSTKLKSGATGYTQLAAATVVAYQVDQALVFTPDQNNLIDLTTYSYLLVIGDEGAGNMIPGNRFAQVALSMTAIPDARR